MAKLTVADLLQMKRNRQKITEALVFDVTMTRIFERAGADVLLVGDSYTSYLLGGSADDATVEGMILFAKAIVFKQGDGRFALVVCDLCHTSPAVVAQARALAAEKTGISADQIAVCATHTHTGPDYFGPLADHLHELALAAHSGDDPCRKPVLHPADRLENVGAGEVVRGLQQLNRR